ncbi:MAG: hypothetical protein EB127_24760 [Alphaproteobacteria bacterium]|jgi:hypothetical protein|nr:hypothetical protein [Alphaproteobacteria bacterium]
MYAIVENNKVVNVGELAILFPSTSFPANGEYDDFLSENNVKEVVDKIEFNPSNERLVFCEPYIQGGKVYVVKKEVLSNDDKKDELLAHIEFELISTDGLDTKEDLSQAHKDAWKRYREKLELLKEYSSLSEVTWPEKPVVYGGTGDN